MSDAAERPSRLRRLVDWSTLTTVGLVTIGSAIVFANTLAVRYERDVSRMVFNDNLELLRVVHLRVGAEADSLSRLLSALPQPAPDRPSLVVSIEENRLWYRQGDSVLFETAVATGSGKTLERDGNDVHWRFDTPRGRLSVVSKDTAPVWVAPDWHYVELAQGRGLGVVRLQRGDELPTGDGGTVMVLGSNVVLRTADGRITPYPPGVGNEIVVSGNVVVPPYGTNQRKFAGVLGTHRLNLGDGYAIHGTNQPETIGRSVSHGCVRVTNEDIAILYRLVPVGTQVFIY
jgi:hypothetical protein